MPIINAILVFFFCCIFKLFPHYLVMIFYTSFTLINVRSCRGSRLVNQESQVRFQSVGYDFKPWPPSPYGLSFCWDIHYVHLYGQIHQNTIVWLRSFGMPHFFDNEIHGFSFQVETTITIKANKCTTFPRKSTFP